MGCDQRDNRNEHIVALPPNVALRRPLNHGVEALDGELEGLGQREED